MASFNNNKTELYFSDNFACIVMLCPVARVQTDFKQHNSLALSKPSKSFIHCCQSQLSLPSALHAITKLFLKSAHSTLQSFQTDDIKNKPLFIPHPSSDTQNQLIKPFLQPTNNRWRLSI